MNDSEKWKNTTTRLVIQIYNSMLAGFVRGKWHGKQWKQLDTSIFIDKTIILLRLISFHSIGLIDWKWNQYSQLLICVCIFHVECFGTRRVWCTHNLSHVCTPQLACVCVTSAEHIEFERFRFWKLPFSCSAKSELATPLLPPPPPPPLLPIFAFAGDGTVAAPTCACATNCIAIATSTICNRRNVVLIKHSIGLYMFSPFEDSRRFERKTETWAGNTE